MKYYAVIDTNVLVSAMLRWDSVPGNIIQFIFNGTMIPLLHHDIVNEYRSVLKRPKFHLTDEIINSVVDEIERLGIYVDSKELNEELPDPKDRIFYEVAMEKRKSENTYLVTENIKHFPTKTFIVTLREMLEVITSETK